MSTAEQSLSTAVLGLAQAYAAYCTSRDQVASAFRDLTGTDLLTTTPSKDEPVKLKAKKRVAPAPPAGSLDDDGEETDQLASSCEEEASNKANRSTKSKEKANKNKKGNKAKRARKKHPDAPKKPATGYLRYRSSVYRATREAFPALSAQGVTKQIATQWSALTDREKAPFNEEWKRAQAGWATAMKQFKATLAANAATDGDDQDEIEDEDDEDGGDPVGGGPSIDPYDVMVAAQKKKKGVVAKGKKETGHVKRDYSSDEGESISVQGARVEGEGAGGSQNPYSGDIAVDVDEQGEKDDDGFF
ncbi:hypothetical protein JCM11491_003440 [Sporobolomyces phaffii]